MIGKIVAKAENYFNVLKFEREERFINKYLKTDNLPNDVYNYIYHARKGIAQYAKENGVVVNIRKSRREENLLDVVVIDKSGDERMSDIISDVNNINEHSVPRYFDKASESGKNTIRSCFESVYEENFLRTLYRNICECTKKVNLK